MSIRAQPFPAASFKARTRRGVFWRCLVIGCAAGFALFLSPWISALIVIVFCGLCFTNATAMIATLAMAALLPQASLNLFGHQVDQPFVETVMVLAAIVHALLLFARKQWSAWRYLTLLFICGAAGGILTLSTTQDSATTLRALLQFLIPIFALLSWLDNLFRRATHAYEAPYALAGVLSALALGSFMAWVAGRAYTYTYADLNGVVWQPQILGLCLAPLIVLMVRLRRLSVWLRTIVIVASSALIWLAWSRTGIAALTCIALAEGVRLALMRFYPKLKSLSPKQERLVRNLKRFALGCVFVSALAGSLWFASRNQPTTQLPEATKQVFSFEGYASSRSFPLERSFGNIEDHLGTGLGFGVPSDPRLIDPLVAYENLRILKTESRFVILTDKGNSFVAIVEETGILGAPIWLFLFYMVLLRVASTSPIGQAMAILFILCAIGEATVFTLTGIGMLQWTALVAAAGFAKQPRRRTSQPRTDYGSNISNSLRRRVGDAT